MPYIANKHSVIRVEIVCAKPGDSVQSCITLALSRVAEPQRAYAYFEHNGVIVALDKTSTPESAYQDWSQRLAKMTDTLCDTANIES